MYVYYAVLLRAINKASDSILNFDVHLGNFTETAETKNLLE